MKPKQMLILVASEDINAAEVVNVESQAKLYGISSTIHTIVTYEDLYKVLSSGKKYDYIYLATHGCESSWGNISGTLSITWLKFAACICNTEVLNPGAIFLHSCCKGGLTQVAYQMFACCDKVEFICGPRTSIEPVDLVVAFNLFLFNIETKRIDPATSAEKVKAATDIRLMCFDRAEHEPSADYIYFCDDKKKDIDRAFDEVDEEERKILGKPPSLFGRGAK